MGELAERTKAMTVSVTSPDNKIRALLRNSDDVTIEFRLGSYRSYTEPEIEHQIARLAALLHTGRSRGRMQLMDAFGVSVKKDAAQATSPAERHFLAARQELQVIAFTPRKLVRLKTTGLSQWECRVTQGALRQVDENQFCQELREVANAMIQRYNTKAAALKDRYFGLSLPAAARERLARQART